MEFEWQGCLSEVYLADGWKCPTGDGFQAMVLRRCIMAFTLMRPSGFKRDHKSMIAASFSGSSSGSAPRACILLAEFARYRGDGQWLGDCPG